MATRRKTTKRASKRPASKRKSAAGSRAVNDALAQLGQRTLTEEIKQVLEDLGVNPSKIDVTLTPPKAVRKAARRRR